MSNPFIFGGGKVRPPKRNARDLTRQSLFTSDWGKLYPFFCQEVIPGGSYRIKASVGFRAMQTKFPLQSRIRTSCSFFYVRNRCLFDRWEDFIFKTKGAESGVVSPWLKIPTLTSPNANVLRTGSLGDALGVATTKGGSASYSEDRTFRAYFGLQQTLKDSQGELIPIVQWNKTNTDSYINSYISAGMSLPTFPLLSSSPDASLYYSYGLNFHVPDLAASVNLVSWQYTSSVSGNITCSIVLCSDNVPLMLDSVSVSCVNNTASFNFPDSFNGFISSHPNHYFDFFVFSTQSNGSVIPPIHSAKNCTLNYVTGAVIEPTDNPHVGLRPADPINALPFRAYEMIANYYFRNDLNSPYILDGEVQYNRFIPTNEGGEDTNVYDFHFHNWELDRFVSALPTPQFGEAPLVGLSYRVGADIDKMDFEFESEGGTPYHATLGVRDDKVVSIVDFDQNLPSSNLQNLMQMVNAGFSINTLRDVNSFQRFLENCQRRGLRYRNQLQSHFGVNVDYPDIDIPQYIGGFSSWAEIGQVTNMAEMPDAGLGDYVGTISGMSSSKRDIDIYTPEHGFIIGIYCIYPTPIYTQSEPKYLKKHSPFDYFTPEFGKIGKVPIHYREISPLQTDSNHKLDDVFGYQVPWYDYLDAQDTAHGDFRTTLRDFLIQRLWDSPPELCEDFVRVNPTQLNDIFTTRNIADAYGSNSRFLCSSITKCTALLPIPVHGVPSLE